MRITLLNKSLGLATAFAGCFLACASAETLKVGVISPQTGGGAPWGIAASEAMKMIAADYNAKGGLVSGGKTYQIEVISYDDQYKAADAVAAYYRLRNKDGVNIMLIHTSPAAVATRQMVEDDHVAAICSCASPNAVTKDSKYMVRMNSTPDDYLPGMIKFYAGYFKERRLIMVNPNDEVGVPFVKQLTPLYKANGFDIIDSELVERDLKDFNPLITRILAMQPDVIDLGGIAPATTGLVVRQIREQGYKGLIIKTAAPSPKEIVAAAGKDAAEGMVLNLFADQNNDGFKKVAALYKARVGQEPNEMIVPVYDGAAVLFKAIELSGDPTDTSKIIAAFPKALPMKSVQGDDLTWGGKDTIGIDHEVISTEYIGVIRDGEPVVIGRAR